MIDKPDLIKKAPLNLLANKRIDETELGRKAPQSIELEKAILSAIMLDQDAIDSVRDILTENSFYLPAHQRIYAAALRLAIDNQAIDISLLASQLSKDGTLEMSGGPAYLIELSNTVASSANVEFHARIVAQKYIAREMISLGNKAIKAAYDPTKDVFDSLDEAQSELFRLTDNYTTKDPINTSFVLHDAIKELEERMQKSANNELQGVETGFKKLNELSGGWQKGDLIIVAGRPGMGKTAFTLTLARNAAVMANKSVAFFSLEMPTNQLMMRLISSEASIEQEKIRKGTINNAELMQISSSMDKLNKVNLFFDDTPSLNIMDFRKKVRKLKREHGLDLILIDYLQLMTSPIGEASGKTSANREQQIAHISRSLKSIAKELEVPIIALAQISRQAENRGSSTKPSLPMLSDLRESGSIEQDADMVIFLFREYYYTDKANMTPEEYEKKDDAIISVKKNRNGQTDDIKAKFIGQYVRYEEADETSGFRSFTNFATLDKNQKQVDDFQPSVIKPSKMNDLNRDEFFIEDNPIRESNNEPLDFPPDSGFMSPESEIDDLD